jgi:tripartite-type tricarboxylate transporter receptor subunit TctC
MYLNQLVALPGLQADVHKFNWIGRAVGNSTVLFARADAAVKKASDLFTKELIVSASGSSSRLNWTALNKVAATKLRLITGYSGTRSARLALERGEVQALSLPWFSIRHEYADELKEGKFNLILQAGIEKNADLSDLPRMMDLAKDASSRKILEIFSGPSLFGRSLLAPPELPRARVVELRDAFSRTIKDPAFTADAAKLMLDLDPLPGERLQAMLGEMQYAPELIERVRAIARPSGQN